MTFPYPYVATIEKLPGEVKWVGFNWAAAFPNETIVTSEWAGTNGLTIVTSSVSGKIAKALVGGGTANGYVEHTLTLDTGEIRKVRVKIELRS
jgi:hypothetical protein